jgi:2-keto-3-deoxy-6-phosphogluconate aldolase
MTRKIREKEGCRRHFNRRDNDDGAHAVKVISELVRELPEVLTGAATVLDAQMARQCLDAGAQFLVSPGLDLETVQHAVREPGW